MAVMHKIKAHLYDNALTENPNDFVARVFSEKSLSVADVCESAVKRGGADISADAMRHAVGLYLKEMGYRLCDGFAINTGYFTAQPVIRGTFYSPAERFDANRHSVAFDFHQGALLRKELGTVEVQILGAADVGAFIAQVVDVKTGSVNDNLTPNRNLKILGSKLKIAGDSEDIGVYFVPTDGGERVKVDPSDVVKNDPSELLVLTPALTAGAYTVEVVTQFTNSSKMTLKEPRTAVLDKILTVT
jgi:hypothetical protein